MLQEDALRLLNVRFSQPIDFWLELFPDFLEGLGIKGAVQGVIKKGDQGIGVFLDVIPRIDGDLFNHGWGWRAAG
jgi:hypothetical protein